MKKNKNKPNSNLETIVKKRKKRFYSQIDTTINLQGTLNLCVDFLLITKIISFSLLQTKLLSTKNLEFFLYLIKLLTQ